MAQRRRTYLIQDPYDTDAQRFIDTIFTYFGLRPVCFYTNPKGRFYGEQQFPMLRSGAIEAAYDVSLDDLATFADEVNENYDILAVIPYREDTVEVAAELCGLLELDWNEPETVARFRDKHALKSYLRQSDSRVRVPVSRIVATIDDVYTGEVPDRVVIKPNDGYGNREIGIFDSSQRREIEEKLVDRTTTWILEEFIEGEEYEIDGQVRPDGTVEVLAVYRYNRTTANGYSTVYHSQVQLLTDDPVFTVCADYATAVMTASGLRASPFHMEAKIDDRGPAMVDLGARLPSEGGGDGLSRLHPTRPDVYTVAAHDYVGVRCECPPIDWTHYNAARQTFVFGISHAAGRIGHLAGIDEIEAMPEFTYWPSPPRIGQPVHPTTELHEAPYIAALCVPGDDDAVERAIEYVHSTVSWTSENRLRDAGTATLASLPTKAARKALWLAHLTAEAVRRR